MSAGIWRIEMFGGMRVQRGDRLFTRLDTRKTAALLACLALRLHHAQPREVLVEQLWPDEDPDAIRNRLRQALSALRKELEPPGTPGSSVIAADKVEVGLVPGSVTTDVAEFEEALRQAAHTTDAHTRSQHLRRAVDLYGGELLPGFYEEWIEGERERLGAEYGDALVSLARSLADEGDPEEAIRYARRLVALDPLREDAHVLLMRAYRSAERPADAIRQYAEMERGLHQELGTAPSASATALLTEIRGASALVPCRPAPNCDGPSDVVNGARLSSIEPDGGAVPLASPFYVARAVDAEFGQAIARRDSIVLVKGPRHTGKTSLLARGLKQARDSGSRIVLTDLQKLSSEQMSSAERLFRTLAESLADQVDLEAPVDAVWSPARGWNVNFERFVRREVLGRAEAPVVWGLDEVDRLLAYAYGADVLALFRSWHNERSLDPDGPWGRLTLVIAYATEAHLYVPDLNQSPFNVGTRVTVEDFTVGEVTELNRRYGRPLGGAADVRRFMDMVGGHPYLVRRGLHEMVTHGVDVPALEAQAAQEAGVFADHLRRAIGPVLRDPSLCEAVRSCVSGKACDAADSFGRLRSAGILLGESELDAKPRCGLYRHYLERHLR